MKNYLLIFVLLGTLHTSVHAQNWQWSRNAGCGNSFTSTGLATTLKTDRFDNVIAGFICIGDSMCIGGSTFYTHGTLSADTGHYNDLLVVAKYNSSGTVLWARANSWGRGILLDIAADDNGNVYELGNWYGDSIRFDSNLLTTTDYDLVHSTNYPYYLIKYDPDGNISWIRTGGLTSILGGASLRMVIEHDNVYVCGSFTTDSTKIGTHILYKSPTDYAEAFVAKYNTSGDVVWIKAFVENSGLSLSIVAGSDDHIYVTMGGSDFLVKLDSAGNKVWAKSGPDHTFPHCLATDRMHNIYVGGNTWLTTTPLIFGADTFVIPDGAGLAEPAGLMLKFDSSGKHTDAKCLPSAPGTYIASPDPYPSNSITAITIDSCNNLWLCGSMFADAGIQLDKDHVLFAPTGNSYPMFIAEYDYYGNLLQHELLASGTSDAPINNMATDRLNNIYVTGEYSMNNFGIGADTLTLSGNGQFFIAKYSPLSHCSLDAPAVGGQVNIYPNPADNILTASASESITQVSILNMLGQIVFSGTYNAPQVEIDVAGLPTAMYILKVNNEVRKFVKR